MIEFNNEEVYWYALEKIDEHIIGKKIKHKTKVNFRCPICGDSKKNKLKMRGWIMKTPFPYFKCYNECGVVNIFKFLSIISNEPIKKLKSEFLKKFNYNRSKIETIKKQQNSTINTLSTLKFSDKILQSIPLDWVDYTENDICKSVVESRKILCAPNLPTKFKLYYSSSADRLVIPWMMNGQIYTWQYRYLTKDQTPPYIFPTNRCKPIVGIENLDESFPYIFLGEGILDMIWVKNGCTTGVNISTEQQDILSKFPLVKHVWMFDNQYKDETAYKKYIKLAQNNNSIFIWPTNIKEKDVNEFILKHPDDNRFFNTDFLESNIYTGAAALVKLKFRR